MSFSLWFRAWIKSFCRVLNAALGPYKSEARRKRERERRLLRKYAPPNPFRTKKHRTRRSHLAAQNEKFIKALIGFAFSTLSLVFLPLGLLSRSRKSARKNRGAGRASSGRAVSSPPKAKQGRPAAQTTAHKESAEKKAEKASLKSSACPPAEEIPSASRLMQEESAKGQADESTPRSHCRNENDRYIRKRMTVAGSSYCRKEALEKLRVGSYLSLVPEPTNEYDSNAVMLMHGDEKIGYIAKKDLEIFLICLKLKRSVYGVITAIDDKAYPPRYEYEAWIES